MAEGHAHGDIIIIKKKISGGHGHHGGAWKIAFADFMTAMMAFFLVLWIINATDKDTKTVIARYFNPVKLENPAKAKKGVHGETSAQSEGKEGQAEKTDGKPTKEKPPKGSPPTESKAEKTKAAPETPSSQKEARMQANEAQLFSQPYQALDRIAAQNTGSAGASPSKGEADPQRLDGALSVDSFRDPFKPAGPGLPDDPVAFDANEHNQPPSDAPKAKVDDDKPQEKPQDKPQDKPAPGEAAKPAPDAAAGAAKEGDKAADGAKGPAEEASPEKAETSKFEKELKQKVAAALKSSAGPDIEARQTKEGLIISLTDKLDFSMFAVGSGEPRPELVRAMEAIGKLVKATPGHIVVRGYTDARPYRNGAYDNWRLSSDRAQMAYYMLTRGGVAAARFERVEGYADRALKDPAHPLSAVNRRLEILIEGAKP